MSHKLSKPAAEKKLFPKCVCYRYNLLQRVFFIPCDHRKTVLFIQIQNYLDVFCYRNVAALFELSVSKEVRILSVLLP